MLSFLFILALSTCFAGNQAITQESSQPIIVPNLTSIGTITIQNTFAEVVQIEQFLPANTTGTFFALSETQLGSGETYVIPTDPISGAPIQSVEVIAYTGLTYYPNSSIFFTITDNGLEIATNPADQLTPELVMNYTTVCTDSDSGVDCQGNTTIYIVSCWNWSLTAISVMVNPQPANDSSTLQYLLSLNLNFDESDVYDCVPFEPIIINGTRDQPGVLTVNMTLPNISQCDHLSSQQYGTVTLSPTSSSQVGNISFNFDESDTGMSINIGSAIYQPRIYQPFNWTGTFKISGDSLELGFCLPQQISCSTSADDDSLYVCQWVWPTIGECGDLNLYGDWTTTSFYPLDIVCLVCPNGCLYLSPSTSDPNVLIYSSRDYSLTIPDHRHQL